MPKHKALANNNIFADCPFKLNMDTEELPPLDYLAMSRTLVSNETLHLLHDVLLTCLLLSKSPSANLLGDIVWVIFALLHHDFYANIFSITCILWVTEALKKRFNSS